MKERRRQQDDQSSFKRYCEYEAFQSLNNSKDSPDQYPEVETEVIMFPPPRQLRSKTAFATRSLAFKNIGENIESKPRLGQRNVYSRQNIQIMNKKLRQLKESMFASTNIEAKSPQRNNNTQIRLNGFSSMFTSFTLAAKNKRNIHSCANLRTRNPESPKPSSPLQPESKIPRTKTKKSTRSMRQLRKIEQNKPCISIKPNNFRATLKQKHVDDNPKILANIIKKKVECMKTEEVHDYIQSLMRRKD